MTFHDEEMLSEARCKSEPSVHINSWQNEKLLLAGDLMIVNP